MRSFAFFAVLFVAFTFAAESTKAATIFVDLDPSTMGIQTSLTLPSTPAMLSVDIIYDPNTGPLPSQPFTGFGVDLAWTITGSAGVMAPPNLIFGGLPNTSVSNVPPGSQSLSPGQALVNLGLAPIAGVNGSIGGGAADQVFATFDPSSPVLLASATFGLTGNSGDTFTFTPSGTLPLNGVLADVPAGAMMQTNGFALQNFGVFSRSTLPVDFTDSTLTISAVPEPSSFLALAMVGGVATFRRRRR